MKNKDAEGIEVGKFYDKESKQYFVILKFNKDEYKKYREQAKKISK